jgi:predicted amidohydrolase YtcJ
MHGVGVALAFGSDSPVTPLDPWGSVRAAMCHHNPAYRMNVRAAFAAHTRGGWRAAHRDDEGGLAPGAPATFALWDAPHLTNGLPTLVAVSADEETPALPRCLRTVLRGQTIFSADSP